MKRKEGGTLVLDIQLLTLDDAKLKEKILCFPPRTPPLVLPRYTADCTIILTMERTLNP